VNGVVLAFASAIVCVANLPFLIDWSDLVVGLPLILFALTSRIRVLSSFYLGAIFPLYVAGERISAELPVGLAGKDLRVTGVVADLPRESGFASRFRFRVIRTLGEDFRGDVLISCYRCEARFVPGDVMQATLRLNRPRGTLNPDLLDYEVWLFTKNLKGAGYIREVGPWFPLDETRLLAYIIVTDNRLKT